MLGESIKDLGAGRSILVDSNGVVIAGNKTLEAATKAGIEDALVVETDGTRLVVVKRTDLDLTKDKKAKLMAIADNRVAELDLNWDTEVLESLSTEVDLSRLFPEGVNLDGLTLGDDDDDEETDYEPGEEQDFDNIPESSVRMAQLFLDTETHPLFLEMVEKLDIIYGTDNPTDCVMAGLRELCTHHAIDLENG